MFHAAVQPLLAITNHLQFDEDRNGHITCKEIGNLMKSLGEDVPGYKIRDMIKEVDIDENGTVEFDEFIEVSHNNNNSDFDNIISSNSAL